MALERHLNEDERGLSLIETLTALLLFSMITVILYSFLLMGVSMYKRISVESQIRNQGDALYGQVISELRDAIYARTVDGAGELAIRYLKRAELPEDYVDVYTMKIEQKDGNYGVSIYNESNDLTRRFALTSDIIIDLADGHSYLLAEKQDLINLKMTYRRADHATVIKAQNPEFLIDSKVPLYRND